MNAVAVEAWAFPPEPSSTREARRRVSDLLEASDLDVAAATAALVVSELVTNAVLHARTPFEVRMRVDPFVVRIEVHDGTGRKPTMRYFSDHATSGRGLRLVEALSDAWGVDTDVDGGGKTVWAEVSTTDPPRLEEAFDLDGVEDW